MRNNWLLIESVVMSKFTSSCSAAATDCDNVDYTALNVRLTDATTAVDREKTPVIKRTRGHVT